MTAVMARPALTVAPGSRLTVTHGQERGHQVVIWSAAPSPATYWAHLGDQTVVLVSVRNRRDELTPRVTVEEYA